MTIKRPTMKLFSLNSSLLIVSISLLLASCGGEDCTPLQSELTAAKAELANRDSLLDAIGSTFSMIDSNMLTMKTIEGELIEQMKSPQGKNDAIRSNVEKMKQIMALNQSYIDRLESNLRASSSTSLNLFSIISSMEEKVMNNNLRLARLNHDLGSLGTDFKDMFDEYMQSEVERMVLQENLQSMEGNLSSMEAQMKELKNNLNTVYVAVGTKRELIKSGVLEKGGFLKSDGVNDDLDRLAFTPHDLRTLDAIEVGGTKVKLVTDHPSESYKVENGKLVIEAPKLFWSISKYLIVVTD